MLFKQGHVALYRNPEQGFNTLYLRLILGDLYSACPHREFYTYPAFYTVGLNYQTPTLMPVCQAGRQFVPS